MFEKITRILIILLVTAAVTPSLSGCGQKNEKSGPTPAAIPENVGLEVPVATPLSAEQKTAFLERFKALGNHLPAHLLWVPARESYQERQEREKKRADSPTAFRALLEKIEADCKIHHPSEVTVAPQEPVAGSVISTKSEASIQPRVPACPSVADEKTDVRITIRSFDQSVGLLAADASGDLVQTHENLTEEARATGMKSVSLRIAMSGNFEMSRASERTFITLGGPFTITPAQGETLRLTIEGKALSSPTKQQQLYHVRGEIDGVPYVLTIYSHSENSGKPVQEHYLNGEKIDDPGFGDGFQPAPNSRARLVEDASALLFTLVQ